jgi:hypothetical protein
MRYVESAAAIKERPKGPLKLDFGCGPNKAAGFHGVDSIAFDGVDFVLDVATRVTYMFELPDTSGVTRVVELPPAGPPEFEKWPWADESVAEAHSSHFVEHLVPEQRVHFFNELYRVLEWGGKATIIVPSWAHERAYGDPTHKWPAVSNWLALYLQKSWRDANAPHTGYTCDFDWGSSATWDEWLNPEENMEEKIFAMQRYVNSTSDLMFKLTKTKRA